MKFSKVDKTLLVLGAILIAISFYQLFFQFYSGNRDQKSLGRLASTEAVVKTKLMMSLDWNDAFEGADVKENQLIYTDADSSADVVFHGGGKITVSENSLVRLHSKNNLGGINIEKGIVRATVSGDRPISVNLNGKNFMLSAQEAEVQINLNKGLGEIGVLSGELSVTQDGNKNKLNRNLAMDVTHQGVMLKKVSYQLLSPAAGSKFYIGENDSKISFTWNPAKDSKIHISKDVEFSGEKIYSGIGEYEGLFDAGVYYWRVQDEEGTSLVSSFQIISESPLKILKPSSGSRVDVLEYPGQDSFLKLSWSGKANESYILEWNDGEENSVQVNGTSTQIPINRSLELNWRVKVQNTDRPFAVWSEWQKVEVKYINEPQLPIELYPHEVEYQLYRFENEAVELKWKSNQSGEIEVTDDTGETKIFRTNEQKFNMPIKKDGAYRWRVRSVDSFKRASEWSEWKVFQIKDMSGDFDSGVQRIQLRRPDQEVKFMWEKNDKGVGSFELSDSREFNDILVHKEVESEQLGVVVPKTGDYYWRVRYDLGGGQSSYGKAKRVIIEPTPPPVKPEKLPDLEVPLEWRVIDGPPTSSFLDFFISPAYAQDLRGVAKLTLPEQADAKFYLIRIYKDEEMKTLVFEKKLKTNFFEWFDAEPGNYYWQYAIIDYWDRQSLFSEPSELVVTQGDFPDPVKPRLIFPVRGVRLENLEFKFDWSKSPENANYELQISGSEDFDEDPIRVTTKKSFYNAQKFSFPSGKYFWRVIAKNRAEKEIMSNTARFTLQPPLEVESFNKSATTSEENQKTNHWEKVWKNRASFSFVASKDNYTFSEGGRTGTIDGIAKLGFEAQATFFHSKSISNLNFIRQWGTVFEGESYVFQRFLYDWAKFWGKGDHRFAFGVAAGFSLGQAYDINLTKLKVLSTAVSGAGYGPIIRSYHAFSSEWEMQNKLTYLLGEIPQTELTCEWLQHKKSSFRLWGIGYSMRSYKFNQGTQNSFKFSFGLGKEF